MSEYYRLYTCKKKGKKITVDKLRQKIKEAKRVVEHQYIMFKKIRFNSVTSSTQKLAVELNSIEI